MREDSSAIYVARGASYILFQNIAFTTILATAFAIIIQKMAEKNPTLSDLLVA